MKILVVGDPHGKIPKLRRTKDIDVILITGDIGKADFIRKIAFDEELRKKADEQNKELLELIETKKLKKEYLEIINSSNKVFRNLSKIAPVYWIYGNIENVVLTSLKRELKKRKISLSKKYTKIKNVHLINSEVISYKNIRIAGTEYFYDPSFIELLLFSGIHKERKKMIELERKKLKKFLQKIGSVDILLSHNPPYKILDIAKNSEVPKGKHVGSRIVLKYCKKYKPRYVLFGHIHEAKGKLIRNDTIYINLGYNGDYQIIEI